MTADIGEQMTDPRELKAMEALDALCIPYVRYEHGLALTMEDCAHIGADVGAKHCKNLFLVNRQGTAFYLLLIAGWKQFRTAEVSRQLGVARLSFANADQLMAKLGLLPGAVTPLGLLNDADRAVRVVMDEDVRRFPMVCVHPMVSTASLALSGSDLVRFIGSLGYAVDYVRIADDPAAQA